MLQNLHLELVLFSAAVVFRCCISKHYELEQRLSIVKILRIKSNLQVDNVVLFERVAD